MESNELICRLTPLFFSSLLVDLATIRFFQTPQVGYFRSPPYYIFAVRPVFVPTTNTQQITGTTEGTKLVHSR